MSKKHSPRKGSLGVKRKRAEKELPAVANWPEVDETILLGFPAYKCGMATVYKEEKIRERYQEVFGKETTTAGTVLEVPPIRILAIRAYKETPYGKKTFKDVWAATFSEFEKKYLGRRLNFPQGYDKGKMEEHLNELSGELGQIDEVRVIARTMPELTGIGRKKPKLLEVGIGGVPKEAFKYGSEHLGRKVQVDDVFKTGNFVDSIGVTKGQGFQGVVKRFGIRLLPPKTKKGIRKVAAMGAWHPARTSWRVPQAGQTGFHKRTERNKQILEILEREAAREFNPSGGWKHYGTLREKAIILHGSVQGPQKRTLILRHAIDPKEKEKARLKSIWYSDEKLKEF